MLAAGELAQALVAVDEMLGSAPNDTNLLTTKGLILWRLGRRGEAITHYERAAAIDPEGPGARFLDNARDIMAFFNPDLLNP